jgi:hypothetical protein
VLLLLCFALAYAIQGAVKQSWADGSKAAKSGYAAVRGATSAAVKRGRASDRRGVRWVAAAGQGLWSLLGLGVRGGHTTGRALWTGGKAGWVDGRRRGARRWARRRVTQRRRRRDRDRARDGQPTIGHYLTGRCPQCGHTRKEAAAGIPGCACTARDWGCACSRRHRVTDPARPPLSLVKPPRPVLPKPPSGGDGAAAGDDPVAPTSTDPTPGPDPTPEPTQPPTLTKEPPVADVVSEAVGIAPTRRNLEGINAAVSLHLDTASAAKAEAEQIRRSAEQMRASMSANDVDPETLAAIAALLEQAARLEAAAVALANAADGTRAATVRSLKAINTHKLVEEAVNAHVHAADTEWYRAGR